MDLMSNIVGKTPYIGLITNQGRMADWLVDVRVDELPNPQLLGAAIGSKVQVGVPYIIGLDRLLGIGINPDTSDYLQEMGAACATYSAVDLYHVEHITPEAVEHHRNLLLPEFSTYLISEDDLLGHRLSYPLLWTDREAAPNRCYIGCPHLSLRQIYWWTENLDKALQEKKQEQISIETTICAANSNKLRAYTTARFYTDEELLEVLASGDPNGGAHAE
jgi:predicted aconitase